MGSIVCGVPKFLSFRGLHWLLFGYNISCVEVRVYGLVMCTENGERILCGKSEVKK